MYYNSHLYNAMQFTKRSHFIHSPELRECSFIHSCTKHPLGPTARYPALGLAPHHGKGGRSLPGTGAGWIGPEDNFSHSTAVRRPVWGPMPHLGWRAPENGRAAWASSLLPKEHSPPALKETTKEQALSAALGSRGRSGSSLGSTRLLPFLSSVLTRPYRRRRRRRVLRSEAHPPAPRAPTSSSF